MSLSIYDASVPVFLRAFGNLSAILDKAVAHAEAHEIDPAVLVEARLAPDMLPLSGQVQRASDAAKGCAARLTGSAIPSFPDEETSFPELEARIARTTEFLASLEPAHFEGAAERPVSFNVRRSPVEMPGSRYLLTFALPNFFFHVTTAYDILRHKGLEIGKMDYLGAF